MTDCILCDMRIIGRPYETAEGPMCLDSAGCRRRALMDKQCKATINGRRCEKRVGHVEAMQDEETPDVKERRHLVGNTTWHDQVPVKP